MSTRYRNEGFELQQKCLISAVKQISEEGYIECCMLMYVTLMVHYDRFRQNVQIVETDSIISTHPNQGLFSGNIVYVVIENLLENKVVGYFAHLFRRLI